MNLITVSKKDLDAFTIPDMSGLLSVPSILARKANALVGPSSLSLSSLFLFSALVTNILHFSVNFLASFCSSIYPTFLLVSGLSYPVEWLLLCVSPISSISQPLPSSDYEINVFISPLENQYPNRSRIYRTTLCNEF